ncbi:MAG: chromate resistance protein [Deltaproteobacteria bacterium]|nr:chromate resistance protein [Deltaproteobacteria bacterium]
MTTPKRQKDSHNYHGWLLYFYSVPSKPVNSRMKIWRMLTKAGAVQFKGAGYLLPFSDDHYELFQWLVSSAAAMGGEASFVKIERIETMKDSEIIQMFNQHRAKDYLDINKKLDELERGIGGIKKGTGMMGDNEIEDELHKVAKEFQEIGKIDFFLSDARKEHESRFNRLTSEFTELTGAGKQRRSLEIAPRRIADYQGKRWVTRKRPFVDRMASAWLLKRFIDKDAAFGFVDEDDLESLDKDTIAYDVMGGEFTHVGDMSTFEVLLKAFRLKDKVLGIIAEIIHQLDLNDEKYRNPAADGLREILEGVRKTARDDNEALEKGMGIMEMLYASKC